MGNKLYVGNLGFDVDSSALQQLFALHGTVCNTQVLTDRVTGHSKGFGFVQMGTDAEAQAAITSLHGKSFRGRNLTVNLAEPRAAGI